MKLRAWRARDGMSRREFLRARIHGTPVIDRERCTGCGLCALQCEPKALAVNQITGDETYQLIFRQEACNACRVCQKACPEHCLQWIEKEPDRHAGDRIQVIFQDEMSKCDKCGVPLFPRAMVKRLESKIRVSREVPWPICLCPPCRIAAQFGKETAERTPT